MRIKKYFKKEQYKKLKKFLKKKNAWKNYKKNFNAPFRIIHREEFYLAFLWGRTKEGYKYWSKLNSKWIKELKND